jgi:hypothetical protein
LHHKEEVIKKRTKEQRRKDGGLEKFNNRFHHGWIMTEPEDLATVLE